MGKRMISTLPPPSNSTDTYNCARTWYGGEPLNCTHDGIAGGQWGSSTHKTPVLLQYKIAPITQFIDIKSDFEPAVLKGLEQALTCYAEDKKNEVRWSWDPHGFGGNCDSAVRAGKIIQLAATSQVVSSCNNGCDIQFKCGRGADGTLTATHLGCNGDVYTGDTITSGCSVVKAFGQDDKTAGVCCID